MVTSSPIGPLRGLLKYRLMKGSVSVNSCQSTVPPSDSMVRSFPGSAEGAFAAQICVMWTLAPGAPTGMVITEFSPTSLVTEMPSLGGQHFTLIPKAFYLLSKLKYARRKVLLRVDRFNSNVGYLGFLAQAKTLLSLAQSGDHPARTLE